MFGKNRKVKPDFQSSAEDEKPIITIRYQPDSKDIVIKKLSLMRPPEDKDGEQADESDRMPANEADLTLVNEFDLTVRKGDRIVLTGSRGCGKSTLLRAIEGLWDRGHGEIALPFSAADKKERILCVPQRPYIPPVPYRGILSYPYEAGKYTDEEMADALRNVGLERMIPRLQDEAHDGTYWTPRLSPGEQQALCFARIFLRKPDILMLDEATSSLDEASAVGLYRKLLEKLPDVTLISIVHHKEIIPFHTLHASIDNKNLTVRTIASEAAPAPPAPDAPH